MNFTVVRAVLRNNYWSHNLIGPYRFCVISPRNSTSFTRPFHQTVSRWEACAGWSWDYVWPVWPRSMTFDSPAATLYTVCYLMTLPPIFISHHKSFSNTYHLHDSLSADSNGRNARCCVTANRVIPISDHTPVEPCMSRVCSRDYESHVTLRIWYLNIWKYLEVELGRERLGGVREGGREKEEGKGRGEESAGK